jgi:hypothetical protein
MYSYMLANKLCKLIILKYPILLSLIEACELRRLGFLTPFNLSSILMEWGHIDRLFRISGVTNEGSFFDGFHNFFIV